MQDKSRDREDASVVALQGTEMTMGWSDLPADLVAVLADRTTDHADFACFRSVCPSWRSASAAHAARRRVPLLLLPAEYQLRVDLHLWSLADDSIAEIPLPAALGSFLFASPRGWALAVDQHFSAAVLHPFTGASAALPELPPSFRADITVRRDMVWDHSPQHTVVIARRSQTTKLLSCFFCRPGDGFWSAVECSEEIGQVSGITYFDGAFYLFDGETLRTVGVDSETFAAVAVIEPPTVTLVTPDERLRPWNRRKAESTLVVSSADDFLVIDRRHELGGPYGGSGEVVSIEAFRWDGRSWAAVDDIGDRAVFVDSSRGFCVEANGVNGVQRNCVYVATSNHHGRCTVSVLHLAGRTTERLSLGNLSQHRCGRFWQWPSWSMPNLHRSHPNKTKFELFI
uniref:Uncharacterized protein n=1 Tax=Avena sativa TaxID=4498 RepID=A0ACD5XX33_AVESA